MAQKDPNIYAEIKSEEKSKNPFLTIKIIEEGKRARILLEYKHKNVTNTRSIDVYPDALESDREALLDSLEKMSQGLIDNIIMTRERACAYHYVQTGQAINRNIKNANEKSLSNLQHFATTKLIDDFVEILTPLMRSGNALYVLSDIGENFLFTHYDAMSVLLTVTKNRPHIMNEYKPDNIEQDIQEYRESCFVQGEKIREWLRARYNKHHSENTTEKNQELFENETISARNFMESFAGVINTLEDAWLKAVIKIRKEGGISNEECNDIFNEVEADVETADEKYSEFKRKTQYLPKGGNGSHDEYDEIEILLDDMKTLANDCRKMDKLTKKISNSLSTKEGNRAV